MLQCSHSDSWFALHVVTLLLHRTIFACDTNRVQRNQTKLNLFVVRGLFVVPFCRCNFIFCLFVCFFSRPNYFSIDVCKYLIENLFKICYFFNLKIKAKDYYSAFYSLLYANYEYQNQKLKYKSKKMKIPTVEHKS